MTRVVPAESAESGAPAEPAEPEASASSGAPADPGSPWRRILALPGWVPTVVAVACVVVALLGIETSLWDIIRYAGYVAWGVLLPGVLVYRSLRREAHSLVDDLAMGAATGLAIELVAYVLFSSVGARAWLAAWPLAVVAVFVAVPRLRRHWRRPEGYRSAPAGWAWAVAAVVLGYEAYTLVAALRPYPPLPLTSVSWYVQDLQYLLSLVGEYRNHFPGQVPQIAGQPLGYHWFGFAHEATASLISGVDTPVAFLRLGQPVLGAMAVVLLAVAGWRISGRPWVGVLAIALMFVFGEVVVGTKSLSLFGSSTASVWTSYTTLYSWPLTMALIVVVADRLTVDRPGRRGLPDAAIGWAAWPLVAVFAVAAAGAKSSSLPPTIAGVATAVVAGAVWRRWRSTLAAGLCLAGLLVVSFVSVMAAVFRFQSHGLTWHPWWGFGEVTTHLGGASTGRYLFAFVVTAGCYAVYELGRLAGIAVLGWSAWRGRAPWTAVDWFLLGGIVAGIGGTLMLHHPSTSQLYFVRSAWPFGALGSAMGYVWFVERRGVRARTVVVTFATCSVLACLAVLPVWWRAVYHPVSLNSSAGYFPWPVGTFMARVMYHFRLGPVAPVLGAGLALAIVAGVAAVTWRVVRRRRPAMAGLGPVVVLTALFSAGAAAMPQDAYFAGVQVTGLHLFSDWVSRDEAEALRWLRAHSSPDDVIATNRHTSLSFWINSYSERRTLLGSWGYAPKALEVSDRLGRSPAVIDYWDPATLTANDAAFYEPTRARMDWLRERGVRWLVADSSTGAVSPDLPKFAELRRSGGRIAIYHLDG